VLPGVIGTLQATEAIKILSGIGSALTGKLLHYDALSAGFRSIKLRTDPECAVCGNNPSITDVTGIDYSLPAAERTHASITVEELSAKLQAKETMLLLDVREPEEAAQCNIEGSTLIPLGQLNQRLSEIPPGAKIFVHCKSGKRSARAVTLLQSEGFTDSTNVEGGMDAWLNLKGKK